MQEHYIKILALHQDYFARLDQMLETEAKLIERWTEHAGTSIEACGPELAEALALALPAAEQSRRRCAVLSASIMRFEKLINSKTLKKE